jgi:hypothetical protein
MKAAVGSTLIRLVMAAAGIGGAASLAVADDAASVNALVGQGYQITSVFPIEGGYGVFLSRSGSLLLCQINFDAARKGFVTEKCLPVY